MDKIALSGQYQRFIDTLRKKKQLAVDEITEKRLQGATTNEVLSTIDTLQRVEQLAMNPDKVPNDSPTININISNDRYKQIIEQAARDANTGNKEESDGVLDGHTEELPSELASRTDSKQIDTSSGESEERKESEGYYRSSAPAREVRIGND